MFVDRNGLHVDNDKVSAVLNIPTPKTVSEVRRILGMTSWYRRFTTLPDTNLTIIPKSALKGLSRQRF